MTKNIDEMKIDPKLISDDKFVFLQSFKLESLEIEIEPHQ